MKNSNNQNEKGKKINQLIFVEYEKPNKEGHFITVVDSYHNTLGRIHRSYNEQTKKYEFTAYDHAGKPLYLGSDKVWEVKNQFTDNRTQLLEDAHQRRIEAKEQSRVKGEQQIDRLEVADHAIGETGPLQMSTSELTNEQDEFDARNSSSSKENGEQNREEELENLRETNADRDNQSLSR